MRNQFLIVLRFTIETRTCFNLLSHTKSDSLLDLFLMRKERVECGLRGICVLNEMKRLLKGKTKPEKSTL